MAEYFEREALIAKFKQMELGEHGLVERLFADGVYAVIAAFPSADVAPVVHGRWEHGYYCYEPATQCSVCKVCLAKGHRAEKQFTYCPNCGAKMDGGADHE